MYYTGFADEAGLDIDTQIKVTKELGWSRIESRNIDGTNIHDISDKDFEAVVEKLDKSGVTINCFGSTVANWNKDPRSEEDYNQSIVELERAIPRMKKLGCSMIRGMSFTRLRDSTLYTPELESSIFNKLGKLVSICEENGVDYMHENCANYGGMSSEHTLKLLDNIKSPNFKLVYDTGNPLNSIDYRKGYEDRMQNAYQFYEEVKEFIGYVHIKDGNFVELQPQEVFNKADWTFPGEGEGHVIDIISDLITNGYDGGFSIEPHMMLVYHDQNVSSPEEMKYRNYVEYGKKLMKIVYEQLHNG